jgi:hypothetical protein
VPRALLARRAALRALAPARPRRARAGARTRSCTLPPAAARCAAGLRTPRPRPSAGTTSRRRCSRRCSQRVRFGNARRLSNSPRRRARARGEGAGPWWPASRFARFARGLRVRSANASPVAQGARRPSPRDATAAPSLPSAAPPPPSPPGYGCQRDARAAATWAERARARGYRMRGVSRTCVAPIIDSGGRAGAPPRTRRRLRGAGPRGLQQGGVGRHGAHGDAADRPCRCTEAAALRRAPPLAGRLSAPPPLAARPRVRAAGLLRAVSPAAAADPTNRPPAGRPAAPAQREPRRITWLRPGGPRARATSSSPCRPLAAGSDAPRACNRRGG